MYVGEDGKLHYIDKEGADTVLNFSSSIFVNAEDSSNIFLTPYKYWYRGDYANSSYTGSLSFTNGQISISVKAPCNGGNTTLSVVYPYLLDFSKISGIEYDGQDWAVSSNYCYLLSKDIDIETIKGSYYANLYPNYSPYDIYNSAFGEGYIVKNSAKSIKVSSDGQPHHVSVDYSEFNDKYYFGIMYHIYGASSNGSGVGVYKNFRFILM